ncbi:extracellular solute-binding protein [Brachybacterium sp. YJGR34]|uniref:extracellular solute-binding protein n=1 Tax=Brachybacterium sp. YJGR34 TaxID=2059911 RepID=UPI000E0AA49E|nr:extracellular solute-binding protein [Brachybacterium sp. YJGR34]
MVQNNPRPSRRGVTRLGQSPLSRRLVLGGALGGAALGALGLSACSGSSGASSEGQVIWSTWGSPEDLKTFDKVQAAYTDNHPETELVFNPVPSYSEYHSKLLTQLSAGSAPDVFYVGDDHVASLLRNDVLLGLNDQLGEKTAGLSADDFNERLLEIATLDGELYALPNDVNPDTLWYDKQALEDAGITEDPAALAEQDQWTTEAYFEMLAKLQASGVHGAAYYNYWATHYSWITSQGGQVYDGDAFVAHEDPLAAPALQDFADRFVSGEQIVADTLPEGAGVGSLLVTHQLGFLAAGRYMIGSIEDAGVDTALYDIVRWPTPDGAAAPTGVAASYLAVNAQTQAQEAALGFFGEFLNTDGQRLRLEGSGTAVPSIEGADELITESAYPEHAQTMLDMRDLGYANFAVEAAVPDLSGTISVDHMLPLYEGAKDAATTLDEVAALIAEETAQ